MLKKFQEIGNRNIGLGVAAVVLGGYLVHKALNSGSKNSNSNNKSKWFNTIDKASLSNLNDFTTINYNMDIFVDFKTKKLAGKITYNFLCLANNLNSIYLDIKGLNISSVFVEPCQSNQNEKQDLKFKVISIPEHAENLGDQLQITLPTSYSKNQKFDLTIIYQTDPETKSATALNWLEPEQTLGKQHPYLFTQSEPIFGRTIFPCQDSPSVKSKFTASLQVNSKLSAWCSGKLINNFTSGNLSTFQFEQSVPIPAYLFAIVSGNLENKEIGGRCSVITEPEFIEECCMELENMEAYLSTLEEYLTPYSWKEFKIVILPPSFPYGGMENTELTFASPSIIVGDKSQTSVIIHEMAHSWAGNLVSCKNWENFFLNEGLTVFIEHKIVEKVYGKEKAQILNIQRQQDMLSHIQNFGESHTYTKLKPEIEHNNPDDCFSLIPYVKGCHFFMYLEKQLNNDQLFQKFLQSYFQVMATKSVDSKDFLAYFQKFFSKELGQQEFEKYEKSCNIDAWLNESGVPPYTFVFESEGIKKCQQLADQFLQNTEEFMRYPSEFHNLEAELKPVFLQSILDKVDSTEGIKTKIVRFNQVFNMNEQYMKKYDIGVKWFILAIKAGHEPSISKVDEFLGSMGRMKYLRPVYRALIESDRSELAKQLYGKHKNFYHTIASKMVAKDLGL